MSSNLTRIVSFIFAGLFFCVYSGQAQNLDHEKHIEVSLRMIGHEILLSSNDSTSRVLPIIKENDSYRIRFASDFEFTPEELVSTIDRVAKKTNLASSYIVGVENCETGELVYSFKMDDLEQSDIIPCRARLQPKACYSLLFTLLSAPLEPTNNISTESSQANYLMIIGLLALGVMVFYYLWKRKKNATIDPNLIPLGSYQFDKRNTELLIEHQRIDLTSKEGDLLLLLYNAANTTVEREVILNMVWGDEGDYVGRTLDVFISKLRKKLEFDSKVKIVNIRGVGYKLVLDN